MSAGAEPRTAPAAHHPPIELPWNPTVERTARTRWLVLILVVSGMVVAAWWAGADLCSLQVDSFLYPPSFAVLFTPFSIEPLAIVMLLPFLGPDPARAAGMAR